jgi:iron complex outermembrane receptor protein/hemoglobin/transferrin/lactoferrin receptor protein
MSLRRLSLFAFLFALSLFLLAPAAVRAQSAENARLEGAVTDAATGAPLSGASVELPALDRGVSTGSDGTFRLTGLPAGEARVRIRFVGYEAVTRTVALASGETATLDVALSSSTLQGEEVVVTGTPVAQQALEATQQIDAVSPQELETNRSAALGDLIAETVPGAASVQTGPMAGKPVLRGLSGNRLKLLADGIGQKFYQYGVRHFPNTALLEAGRLEVVRGPASILYGSDALGGAINVIPKALPQEGFGGEVGGQYFGNNNERAGNIDLHGGGALGDGVFGVRAGIERRVADNFTTPEEATFFDKKKAEGVKPDTGPFGDPKYTGEIPFTNFNQWTGYAQAGYEGDFGSVQVFGDYWQNRHNFVLPTGGPDDDNPDTKPVAGLGQNIEHANLALKGNLLAGEFVVKPRLSYQRAIRQSAGGGNTLSVVNEAEENGGFEWPLDLKKNIYTGRLDVEHPAYDALGGEVSGTIGAEVGYEDGESTGANSDARPLEPNATVFRAGGYVFEDLSFGEAWTLSAGARLDYRTLESDPPQVAREALGISQGDLENSYTTFSGSFGANYQFADGFALAANLGTGFRAPSIFELYAYGQHGGVAAFQQGNPELSPERSYSADLGLRARTGRLTGELTGYVNYIQDYIFLQNTGENRGPDGGGAPIYSSGQTNARITGLEGRADVAVLSWLTLGVEAAVLTSSGDDLEENNEGDQLLPLIPADRLGGRVRVEPEDDLGMLSAPFVQARVRHAFSKDAAGTYEPFSQFDRTSGKPPFGTASTKGYTLLDVTAGASVNVGPASANLTVGAKNLLDQTYRSFLDTYKGYALSPGRNVFVKLTVPFGTGR